MFKKIQCVKVSAAFFASQCITKNSIIGIKKKNSNEFKELRCSSKLVRDH